MFKAYTKRLLLIFKAKVLLGGFGLYPEKEFDNRNWD